MTIWLPPEINALPETAGGDTLAGQLAAFEARQPELQIETEIKAAGGQGGALSYIIAAGEVAPSVLPDLALLPFELLPIAAGEGAIFPLGGALNADILEDLYPAARPVAGPEGQARALPYALTNLQHLAISADAYNGSRINRLTGLASIEDAAFVYPAAGAAGAQFVLQMYLQAGGALLDEEGRLSLQVEPLAAALAELAAARDLGFLSAQSANLIAIGESWQIYTSGAANITLTEAGQYLAAREGGRPSAALPAPGIDSPLVPLVRGWAWTLTAREQSRRPAAAELLLWLSQPDNMAAWSEAAGRLPARRSALRLWASQDGYIRFLSAQLEQAQPFPEAAGTIVLGALSQAAFNVLSLQADPQAAAEEAAANLTP
ncbi:MAG: extracellular solute-binding protein [Candidatus Promineifilaceae bacterium]